MNGRSGRASGESPAPPEGVSKEALKRLRRIFGKRMSGVASVGSSWDERGNPCIRIEVESSLSGDVLAKIPKRIRGYPVVIWRAGEAWIEAVNST